MYTWLCILRLHSSATLEANRSNILALTVKSNSFLPFHFCGRINGITVQQQETKEDL